MINGKDQVYDALAPEHGNASTHERSAMGAADRSLSDKFHQAAKSEKTYLRNLDYNNEVAILSGGEPIVARQNVFSSTEFQNIQKRKHDEHFYDFLLSLTAQQITERINDAYEAIKQAADKLREIVFLADEEIVRINDILQEITNRHNRLNDAIEAQDFGRDHEGRHQNELIANTLKAYVRRTGKALPEEMTPDDLMHILRKQVAFEKTEIVPSLEDDLLKLDRFRHQVQNRQENFENEDKRIEDALKAIDANKSLGDDERREMKIKLLKDVSNTALDAQAIANRTKTEFVLLVAQINEHTDYNNHKDYVLMSHNESSELFDKVQNTDLSSIKPFKL